MAIEAGATHIDTCVLGIGERNGITPLGGFLGRMYTLDKEGIKNKYDLKSLKHVEKYVADAASVQIPFNNYITGESAFSHKAGVHSKAVVSDPSSYEVIDPADFDIERRIQFAHRLTGWNAMQHRAHYLGLSVSDDQIRAATSMIKNLADEQDITLDHVRQNVCFTILYGAVLAVGHAILTYRKHLQVDACQIKSNWWWHPGTAVV